MRSFPNRTLILQLAQTLMAAFQKCLLIPSSCPYQNHLSLEPPLLRVTSLEKVRLSQVAAASYFLLITLMLRLSKCAIRRLKIRSMVPAAGLMALFITISSKWVLDPTTTT
jgi:hypothetical protein